jgi:DNA-binding GntR family transcriptional regulator
MQWAELNWQFHAALYTPANRPRLLTMIKMLHVNVDRYIRLQIQALDYRDCSQQEHHQLLAACQQHDETEAVKILQHHIGAAAQQLVEYLQAADRTGQPKLNSPILQKIREVQV